MVPGVNPVPVKSTSKVSLRNSAGKETEESQVRLPGKVKSVGSRRIWKRFQMVAAKPERDQKAVLRLINSLATVSTGKRVARAG